MHNSYLIILVLLLLNSTSYSLKFSITRFPDRIFFDPNDTNDYYFYKEITIDLNIGSQQNYMKILLCIVLGDSVLWINHYDKNKSHNSETISQKYNPKLSKTYNFLGVGRDDYRYDVHCKGYLSEETIRLYPVESECYKEQNIPIELNNFILLTENNKNNLYINEAISGILNLSYKRYDSPFLSSNLDLVFQLYQRKIINNTLFGIDNKFLYVGEFPFNKDDYQICIYSSGICYLQNTNITPLSEPIKVFFDIGFLYIKVTEVHFKEIINKYFNELINIQRKCKVIQIPKQVQYIECDKDIQTDRLQPFIFEFEGGLNIKLSFKELLLENKNNKLVFGIISTKQFRAFEKINYDWIFGDIVFRYYSIYFDNMKNMTGFKRINYLSHNFDYTEINLILIMFKLNLFILLIGILVILVLYIYNKFNTS